jgi:hypothetical protein
MAFQLPSPGDFEGQAQAGNALIQQINQGDVSGLLEAGISAVGGALGSEGGAILTDVVGGAMSGYAMYGPCGAAVGAVFGAVSGAASAFSPADSVVATYGVSQGTQTITADVQALGGQARNPLNNNPAGWSMADYLAVARPPSNSKNPSGFMSTYGNVWSYVSSVIPGLYKVAIDINKGSNLPQSGQSAASALASQQPLCTPVWFLWSQSSNIVDCSEDLFFGSGGAGGGADAGSLMQTWIQSTHATGELSQEAIVARALAYPHLPDPFYFSTALYGTTTSSGVFGSGFQTFYWNPDLLNAMATVMAMRCAGASTQAVVSELLIQAAILKQYGSTAPDGSALPGDAALNQYGFRRLLDDHIGMANQENSAIAASAALEPSATDVWGSIVLGATGALASGILAYSLYTRESPLAVVRSIGTRVGRLRRFIR